MAFSSQETHPVIDVMTRLKVHFMAAGGAGHAPIATTCDIGLRSVERILSEPVPTCEELARDELAGRLRRGRPPKADDDLVAWVQALLAEEPSIPATEVLRRSREHGYRGGRSAMSVLVRRLRPILRTEPVVRFEGLPGEYTQFDFGEAWLRFGDGNRTKVYFFAARLKHSRRMHIVVTADLRAESLIRGVIAAVVAFGGSTKEWVFDNPKTVRISPMHVSPPVLHAYLRELVADYRVIPTLCSPRSGNQKGSVENLVGYVKKSFLFARKFTDRADLERQLIDWLHEVNDERPSSATGVIPTVAWEAERPFLEQRPVQAAAADHPLRESRVVGPDGTVPYEGTRYFASATRLGAAATLLARETTVEIQLPGVTESCVHPRRPGAKAVQRLAGQRREMAAALHGRRKHATFRRQCLLELGGDASPFLTALVHAQADWEEPCTELYDLLEEHGAVRMGEAFQGCVAARTCTVGAMRRALQARREVA